MELAWSNVSDSDSARPGRLKGVDPRVDSGRGLFFKGSAYCIARLPYVSVVVVVLWIETTNFTSDHLRRRAIPLPIGAGLCSEASPREGDKTRAVNVACEAQSSQPH